MNTIPAYWEILDATGVVVGSSRREASALARALRIGGSVRPVYA